MKGKVTVIRHLIQSATFWWCSILISSHQYLLQTAQGLAAVDLVGRAKG